MYTYIIICLLIFPALQGFKPGNFASTYMFWGCNPCVVHVYKQCATIVSCNQNNVAIIWLISPCATSKPLTTYY